MLASARRGAGALVVLEGHPGVGKTALLTEAAASAARKGAEVLWGRCFELGREYAFGMVLQLFERRLARSSRSERQELFEGAARRAEGLFGEGPGTQREGDFSLLHALYRLTSNLGERAPLLICVDDVQWADRPSLRFLHYLAHRLEELPVAIVIGNRPREPGMPEDVLIELFRAPTAQELRLLPLSPSALDDIIRVRTPNADDAFRIACHRATAGNPLLLHELLAAVESQALHPTAETARRVAGLASPSLLRWTLLQLRRLPPGCLELARAVAVLGQNARLRTAAALAGLALERAARSADVLGGINFLHTGDPLRFVHPLLHSAVYALVPPARRALEHRTAARLLAGEGVRRDTVARHLLAGSRAGDGWTVKRLQEAAAEATARGAPRSAIDYLTRALEEPPPADLRAHVLVELGHAETLMGAPEAIPRLEEALERTKARRQKAEILCRLGWLVHKQGRLAEARQVFERGRQELGGADTALSDELTAGYLAAALMDPARNGKTEARGERITTRGRARATSATPGLLSAAIAWRLFKGEPSAEIRPVAEHIMADTKLFEGDACEGMAHWHLAACLSWLDALEPSERLCATALRAAQESGSVLLMAEASFARAWPRYWMGRIREAAEDARAAVDAWSRGFRIYLPAAAYWLAMAHMEKDELEEAASALDLASTEERWAKTGWYSFLLAGRAHLAMARGDFKAALQSLIAASESLMPVTNNPAVLPWRSDAALAADRIGDARLARELVEDEVRLARGFGAARPIGVALRAAGLIQGGAAGIAVLRESVATLERSPAKLELTRAFVDLGAALRRAGHRREARQMLRRGLEMAESFGARALDRRAREELLAAGARPRRRTLSGVESLTASERRVAEMAAHGLTNREIAEALFVTRKAVRFHLGNVYRKLGISSRHALLAALDKR